MGSDMSRIGFGQNSREMTTGSLWLQDMAAEPLTVPTISLRNAYDNYVMPQDNQRACPAPSGVKARLVIFNDFSRAQFARPTPDLAP